MALGRLRPALVDRLVVRRTHVIIITDVVCSVSIADVVWRRGLYVGVIDIAVVVAVAGVDIVDGAVAVIIKYVVYLVSRSLTITMDSMQQLGLVADPS